jgi:amino acid transporter
MKGVSRAGVQLTRTLRTTEYFTLAFGVMVGVGWLIVIDDWLARGGPGGAMLGFLLGGLVLVPVAYVYGKFVEAIPDAATELAYAGLVFPDSVSYLSGWLMTLAYLIVCPWEAVAVGKIVSYLWPAIQTIELYSVGGIPVFAPSLALGLLTTALVVFLNYRGIRLSSGFLNLVTFGLLGLFAVFVTMGIGRGRVENLLPLFAAGSETGTRGIAISIVRVMQIVPFFLTGFESVPKCSEEAREGFHPGGFHRAIYLGLGAGTVFYVLIIGVVAALVPWQELTETRYATAEAFRRVFGEGFVRVVVFAALLSLLKVFHANFLTASRLIFALGRNGRIPSVLGGVHTRFRSPHRAVALCGALTVAGALLGESILIPVTEVGSLCSVLGWLVTCLAFLGWRGAGGTGVRAPRDRAVAGAGVAVATALLLLKVVPAIPGSFGRWEYVSFAAWLALGALFRRRRKDHLRSET